MTTAASNGGTTRKPQVGLGGRPRLVVATGGTVEAGTAAAGGVETAFVLHTDVVTLGSADTQDIRVPGAPPQAAELRRVADDDEWHFVDVSAGGSSVDGARWVTCPLQHGDRIEVGDATFVFQRDEVTDDGRATAARI
jgi:hypothetical protein